MKPSDPHIVAVFQGSFDPLTFGHLDIVRRASRVFSRLVVGIGVNPDKQPLFTPSERLAMLKPHLRGLKNVSAATYSGLTIDFVRECGAHVLVRGIRDMADLSNEVQIANLNRMIGGVETMFLLANDQYVLVSSTYIKQIILLGGDGLDRIRQIVPPNVAEALAKRLPNRRRTSAPRRARLS